MLSSQCKQLSMTERWDMIASVYIFIYVYKLPNSVEKELATIFRQFEGLFVFLAHMGSFIPGRELGGVSNHFLLGLIEVEVLLRKLHVSEDLLDVAWLTVTQVECVMREKNWTQRTYQRRSCGDYPKCGRGQGVDRNQRKR